MCGRYELTTELVKLPGLIKKNLPYGFEEHYAKQPLIQPADPVLVLRQENGKISSSFMLWGLFAEWSKDPIHGERYFNARAETVATKPTFRSAWRHRRCLLLASGFFEKGNRIRRTDWQPFWLAGLWNRWLGADGSEIESCTVITTEPNSLVKPLHNRMPVIIPEGLEDAWLGQANAYGLRALEPLLRGWNPNGWIVEPVVKRTSIIEQMDFFPGVD